MNATPAVDVILDSSGFSQTVATSNAAVLSSALASLPGGGLLRISNPGIYVVNATTALPSHTSVYLARGVFIVRINGGSACSIFTNANPATGDRNISVSGEGVLYFNANGYKAAYDANPADCPFFSNLYAANIPGIIESGGTITGASPYVHGLPFDNVDNLFIGGGITLMMSSKYIVYGSQITNAEFNDINLYSDDTQNPANALTSGRDGIHIQGNSHGLRYENIRGTTNDDFLVLNCRDVQSWAATPRATGNITDVRFESIFGKNQRRSGSVIALYSGLDVGTIDPGQSNSFDIAPAITGITALSRSAYRVSTATAHSMIPGQHFTIYGSDPAGFNTNYVNGGGSGAAFVSATLGVRVGTVLGVTDSTHFDYLAPAGPGLTYAGGATLVRYYALQNIESEHVRVVNSHGGGAAVAHVVTTDSALNFGIIDNVSHKDCTGLVTNSFNVSGIVYLDHCRLQNSEFELVGTQNSGGYCLFIATGGGHLAGVSNWKNLFTSAPWRCDPNGFQWAGFNGGYETLSINGVDATLISCGGPTDCVVGLGSPGGVATLENGINRQGDFLGGAALFKAFGSDIGVINIASPRLVSPGDTRVTLGAVDGTVKAGALSITGLNLSTGWFAPMIQYYGSGVTINVQGNRLVANLAGKGGLIQYFNPGTLTVQDLGNAYGASSLFNSDSANTTVSVRRAIASAQVVPFSTIPALDCNAGNAVTLSTALTAGVTWGPPTNIPPSGERVTVTMTQDGTGGRAVAWHPAYVFPTPWTNAGNTAGKKSSVTFVSDGSALVAQGPNSWY